MSEQDFHNDVIDRLARIETQQVAINDKFEGWHKDLADTGVVAREALQSAKSSHHRINDLYIVAGLIVAFVSFIINLFKN